MCLRRRNKLFPWKWNETPLPLPGTHHLIPSLRKKPLWRHIGKRQDPGDKPWNQGTPPCSPSFTDISRHNLHDGQFFMALVVKISAKSGAMVTVSERYDCPGSLLWPDSSSRKSIQLWMFEVLRNQKCNLEKVFQVLLYICSGWKVLNFQAGPGQ